MKADVASISGALVGIKEHQFDRFDLVQMRATKASDPRPESYRVDEASIRLIERSNLTNEAKIQLWQPFIAPTLKQLHEENRTSNRSLGICVIRA